MGPAFGKVHEVSLMSATVHDHLIAQRIHDASTTSAMHACINGPCQGVGSPLAVVDTIVPLTGNTSTSSFLYPTNCKQT